MARSNVIRLDKRRPYEARPMRDNGPPPHQRRPFLAGLRGEAHRDYAEPDLDGDPAWADLSIDALLARARARQARGAAAAMARISDHVLAKARQTRRRQNPFKLPEFPPRATPSKKSGLRMAMDDFGDWAGGQWADPAGWAWAAMSGVFAEGLVFPGYPALAEQAQRPEYRKFAEVLATEMTRKWIRITSTSEEDGDGKSEKISAIMRELDRIRARDNFRRCVEFDELFGRGHLYIDTGATEDRDELKTSIGDGRNEISRAKFAKGALDSLRAVEPVWVYPIDYTAIDPLRDDWYAPQTWFVLGKQVHKTRLLTFVGREVPDLLKPAYSFGGLSMTQMSRPYVDNWLRTRQSVSDLLHAFSVFVLKTNLGASLTDSGDQLFKRVELFNHMRDNRGLMMLDKETEDFQNVSASVAGLHELQAQSQEQMCSIASIPVVKFLGIQPTGLNASDEGGIRMWYDWVAAQQEKRMRAHLTTVIDFVQLSLFGEVDPDIVFAFEPLRELNEKERAELRKAEADTDVLYVDSGILSQQEVRKRVAADPDSPYASIDVEDVPELREEEEAGLDPEATRKHAGGSRAPHAEGEGGGEEEDEFPDELEPSEHPGAGTSGAASFADRVKERGARHDRREGKFYDRADARSDRAEGYLDPGYLKKKLAARKRGETLPAGGHWREREVDAPQFEKLKDVEVSSQDFDRVALDAWEEHRHPRDKGGRFTKGGGGTGRSTASKSASAREVGPGGETGTVKERAQLRKRIKAETEPVRKQELIDRLANSYELALNRASQVGNIKKVQELQSRLKKLGKSMDYMDTMQQHRREQREQRAEYAKHAARQGKVKNILAKMQVDRNFGTLQGDADYIAVTFAEVAADLKLHDDMLDKMRVRSDDLGFEVGDQKYFYAGWHRRDWDDNTIEIALFPKRCAVQTARNVAAHEITHAKFRYAIKKYREELKKIRPEEMRPDGSLREDAKGRYPFYEKMHEVYFAVDPSVFAATDGVTSYSTDHWIAARDGKQPYALAIEETLCEMSADQVSSPENRDRLDPLLPYGHRITRYRGVMKGTENDPVPQFNKPPAMAKVKKSESAWKRLYRAIEELYDK